MQEGPAYYGLCHPWWSWVYKEADWASHDNKQASKQYPSLAPASAPASRFLLCLMRNWTCKSNQPFPPLVVWPWCPITAIETLTRAGSVAFWGMCHFEVLKSHSIPSWFFLPPTWGSDVSLSYCSSVIPSACCCCAPSHDSHRLYDNLTLRPSGLGRALCHSNRKVTKTAIYICLTLISISFWTRVLPCNPESPLTWDPPDPTFFSSLGSQACTTIPGRSFLQSLPFLGEGVKLLSLVFLVWLHFLLLRELDLSACYIACLYCFVLTPKSKQRPSFLAVRKITFLLSVFTPGHVLTSVLGTRSHKWEREQCLSFWV